MRETGTLTEADVREMAEALKHTTCFAEAFMYRYHPKHARVREIIESGEIGTSRDSRIVHLQQCGG